MEKQAELVETLLAEARKVGDCLLCNRAVQSKGYAHLVVNKKHILAHRLVAAHAVGIDALTLRRSEIVRHSCDTPRCINPDHLTIGTAKENTQDMVQKGRDRYETHRGEAHGNSKLSAEDVANIRRLRKKLGLTYRALGEMFGCTATHACRIYRQGSRRDG